MNEEIYKKLSEMLGNTSKTSNSYSSNSSDFLGNISSNFDKNNDSNFNETRNNSSFDFNNIDMETIGKIGNIMSKLRSNATNPRSNLLLSLKPYLKPSRRDKVDRYIQLMNMSSILENFNKTGGEK